MPTLPTAPPSAFDFYAETDGDGRDVGTVAAVHRASSDAALFVHGCYEGLAGITGREASAPSGPAVAWLAIAPAYLDARCRPITEAEARRIHPALFERIDRAEMGPLGDLGTAAAALHLSASGEA